MSKTVIGDYYRIEMELIDDTRPNNGGLKITTRI